MYKIIFALKSFSKCSRQSQNLTCHFKRLNLNYLLVTNTVTFSVYLISILKVISDQLVIILSLGKKSLNEGSDTLNENIIRVIRTLYANEDNNIV